MLTLSTSQLRAELPKLQNDDVYDHYPVDIKTFVSHKDYLGAGEEVWESVKCILEKLFNTDPNKSKNVSTYTEFIYDGGIGSGKSFITSVIFCYVVYRLLCYRNPQTVYGLARGATIACMNMSKSAMQAKKVVFHEIKSRIDNSPWFQSYGKPDDKIQSELRFPKNIVIVPGNSQETYPLGYNLIVANMDEASFFTETEDHDVAEEMFNALSRRLTSRFGLCGLLCITSSPRYIDDFTEKKMEESKINKKIYSVRLATWQSNPRDREDIAIGKTFDVVQPLTGETVKIPLRYESAFKRNPAKAWRDFGAVPSLVLEPFLGNEIPKLEEIMRRDFTSSPYGGTPYYCHIDLGSTRDACGFAVGHHQDGRVVIDFVKRIVSRRRAEELSNSGGKYDEIIGNTEIDFDGVRQLIRDIKAKGYGIQVVSYDSWQSIDSRQILEREGFLTKLISVDRDTVGYDTLKSLINTDCFVCPNHQVLLSECRRLELVKGKKVDHPPNGSKDCSDAVAGVCQSIFEDFDLETTEEIVYNDDSARVEITGEI